MYYILYSTRSMFSFQSTPCAVASRLTGARSRASLEQSSAASFIGSNSVYVFQSSDREMAQKRNGGTEHH